MSKTIWIFNHYATDHFRNKGGRHYFFAKYLKKMGYNPVVFCAKTIHNSRESIDTEGKLYTVMCDEDFGIPFVFIETPEYSNNGVRRVLNMLAYTLGLFKVTKSYAKENGKPYVILASSVHPFTVVAGIKIARRYKVRCVAEIRDLWPQSLVSYNVIAENNPVTRVLYALEKWIYKKADEIVFTMPGAAEYISDRGLDKAHGGPVDLKKVHHINNGVDFDVFMENVKAQAFDDEHLNDVSTKKIVYSGSLRKANSSVLILPKVAKCLSEKGLDAVILIYGKGELAEEIKRECEELKIDNCIYKGFVEKSQIPYVLSKSDLNILDCGVSQVLKYGGSQNKLFEYLASGKPILSGEDDKYSLIKKYGCGISKHFKSAEDIADSMIEILLTPDAYTGAEELGRAYDYKILTEELVDVLGV